MISINKIFLLIIAASAMCAAAVSVQTSRSTPLGVGEVAPDFALEDQHGYKNVLSESRAKSPVVLVFYRGYW
jgi:AhpC/TSA family